MSCRLLRTLSFCAALSWMAACGVSSDADVVPVPAGGAAQGSTDADAQVATRMAALQAMQHTDDPHYQVHERMADNPAQGFSLRFDEEQVVLSPHAPTEPWSLSLQLAGIGHGDTLREPGPVEAIEIDGARVLLSRDDVQSWFLNGPAGVLHGFVVRAPTDDDGGALRIAMAVEGLQPSVMAPADNGEPRLALRTASGVTVAHYGALYAVDANGRALMTALGVQGEHIMLEVDAAEARYPILIDPLVAVLDAKLTASDAASGDYYGYSVSLSGDRALIGAYHDDNPFNSSGSAYVYERNSMGVWIEQTKLSASDAAGGDWFGRDVHLQGDTAIVGARANDDAGPDTGSAYVFTRDSMGTWSQQAKLLASDASSFDMFGDAVAVSGDRAVVGASGAMHMGITNGAAYVFVRDSMGNWSEEAKLFASDPPPFIASFGAAVAIEGDIVAVGAPNDDDFGAQSGSVYIFERNGMGVWVERTKLTASDAATDDELGISVSLYGNTMIAGAHNDDDGFSNSGAAYVFVSDLAGNWSQQAKLVAGTPSMSLSFGQSVSVWGDRALIGADGAFPGGAAYVFSRNGAGVWSQETVFTAPDVAVDDIFGWWVSLSADRALVGAPWNDDAGFSSGSAYVFDLLVPLGGGCANDSECQSGFCVDGVCCVTACGGGVPDDCLACSVAAGSSSDGNCELRPSGTSCRAAVGVCDSAETCDGINPGCPADVLVNAGVECRSAVDACDVAESCDGANPNCPADAVASTNVQCRAAAGLCDVAESCDGVNVACPADAVVMAGTQCRAAAGLCDVAESCDGASTQCPADGLVMAGTECRAAAGDCDVAESCNGASVQCPADGLVMAGTECRAAAGDCDVAESCDGASAQCPADELEMAGIECRATAGDCDVAESCNGTSAQCPADEWVMAGTECRAAAGDCDVAESCDGASAQCPADDTAPDGTSCNDGDDCTDGDMCAQGSCVAGQDICGSGGQGGSGQGGQGTAGGFEPPPESEGGCGCRVAPGASEEPPIRWSASLLWLVAALSLCQRRRQGAS